MQYVNYSILHKFPYIEWPVSSDYRDTYSYGAGEVLYKQHGGLFDGLGVVDGAPDHHSCDVDVRTLFEGDGDVVRLLDLLDGGGTGHIGDWLQNRQLEHEH